MAFPSYTPPQLVNNPYQIAGQAATQLGGQIQQFGEDRDKMRLAYDDMVAKRKEKILADQRAQDEFLLKKNADERAATEAQQKADLAKQRAEFLKRAPKPIGPDGQPSAYSEQELKDALAANVITPEDYRLLAPPKVDKPSRVQEYEYAKQNGFTGSFADFVRPPKDGPGPAQIGSFEDYVSKKYGSNPTPQQIVDAKREYGDASKPFGKLTEKMSNQLVDFSTGVNLVNDLVDVFKTNIAGGSTAAAYGADVVENIPYVGGKIAPDTREFNDQKRIVAETVLRAATGAAAPENEVKRYMSFMPSAGQSKQEAQSKLDSFISQIRSKAKGTTDGLRIQGREQEADEMEARIETLLRSIKRINDEAPASIRKPGGLDDSKKARLEELRRKRAEGTLQ